MDGRKHGLMGSSRPAPERPSERALDEGAKDELSGGGEGTQCAEV